MLKKYLKKKKLSIVMATALTGGVLAGSAQAVSLTPDGLGDAVLFPYYSAQGSWKTFLRLINTSDDVVVAKVRFREAANSREVLDFLVFLSPKDVWNGWTGSNALGRGNAGVRTNDTTCMAPVVGTTSNLGESWHYIPGGDNSIKGAEFKNRAFTGAYDDKTTIFDSKQRMGEGHIEVIGIASFDINTKVYAAAKHSSSTLKPLDCDGAIEHYTQAGKNQKIWEDAVVAAGGGATLAEITAIAVANGWDDRSDRPKDVGNILAANAYMINLSKGQGGAYDPVILANFSRDEAKGSSRGLSTLITASVSTDAKPDLDSADPSSNLMTSEQLVLSGWDTLNPLSGDGNPNPDLHRHDGDKDSGNPVVTGGIDAVSSLLMRTNVINEWAAKTKSDAKVKVNYSQWILTFPTKNYYVDMFSDTKSGDMTYPTLDSKINFDGFQGGLGDDILANGVPTGVNADANHDKTPDGSAGKSVSSAYAPFTNRYWGKSCETYKIDIWNREERHASFTSPAPTTNPDLCYETNVLSFGEEYAVQGLGSSFSSTVPSGDLPTDSSIDISPSRNGWANLMFTGANSKTGLVTLNGRMIDADLAAAIANGTNEEQKALAAKLLLPSTIAYKGLPVTGFAMTVFETGNAGSNHTAISAHKYQRDIVEVK